MTVNEFWEEFLEFSNKDKSTKYYESFYFCDTEELANELLDLVLKDKKKATTSSFSAFEAENLEIPKVGNYSIVTDFAGEPHCVIETNQVTILPFNEMTFDICKREGEDDNLESWKQGHWRFFTRDGKDLGYEFKDDSLVVFEDFEVVYTRKQGE